MLPLLVDNLCGMAGYDNYFHWTVKSDLVACGTPDDLCIGWLIPDRLEY